METAAKQTMNVLLTLPEDLNKKLQREAETQKRKRHAQIIYILERFFESKASREKMK